MNLIEYIETSKIWSCPKSGWWKVICVGGGASLAYNSSGNTAIGKDGEATSFGAYLTALGGKADNDSSSAASNYNAFIGFDVANTGIYGIVADTRNVIETYGRSGYPIVSTGFRGTPKCGRLKVGILNINEGETIACSIGKAVPPTVTAGAVSEKNLSAATGTDGVIVVQYLGSEV